MVSSIQLKNDTKVKLNKLKISKSDSYESVINRLLEKEFYLREELKKGYIHRYDEHKKLNEEWENADSSW